MLVGYIRVSAADQNEARQVDALTAVGVQRKYIEKASGMSADRPELQKMMAFVREGDVLYVDSISRLARRTVDFLAIVEQLTNKGVAVISLKEPIDTTTPQGKFILTVFGALYELEREGNRERQREGIDAAKRRGYKFGRPKHEISPEFKVAYKDWKAGSITAREAQRRCKMKSNTFYRRVQELESK